MNPSRPLHPPRVIQGRFQGGRPIVRSSGHGPVAQPLVRGHAVQLPPSLDLLATTFPGQPLPPAVQAKMEELFGTRLSDVRVHVGPQASSLGALAFTSGSNIYFAPGQYNPHSVHGQRLLGHELAHVVQQRTGRVPNPFGNGVAVVQNPGLEAEAERMSLRVAKSAQPVPAPRPVRPQVAPAGRGQALSHVQRAVQRKPVVPTPAAPVRPGPAVRPALPGSRILQPPPVVQLSSDKRPGFISNSKQSAFLGHNLLSDQPFQVNLKQPKLPSRNAAMPHRMSWKDIRDNTNQFFNGEEDEDDFKRWTDRFIRAGDEKIRQTERAIRRAKKHGEDDRVDDLKQLLRKQERSQDDFIEARDDLVRRQSKSNKKEFLRQANSFHANVPDLGPHFGVNNPVREHTHLNLVRSRSRKRKRSPSPMSRRVLDMSPERLSGIAVTGDDDIITVSGSTFSPGKLHGKTLRRFRRHSTKVIKGFDEGFKFG